MSVDTEISNSSKCFVAISLPTFYITITEKGAGEGEEKGTYTDKFGKLPCLLLRVPQASAGKGVL